MNADTARTILTADQIASAEAAGRFYGEQEAELLADQGRDPASVAWTCGQLAGHCPAEITTAEQRDAYETLIERAAREAFDSFDMSEYRTRNPNT